MPQTKDMPEEQTVAQDFSGLVLDVSPVALPPGAMVDQKNLTNTSRGVLKSRPGLRPVTFEDD